MNKNKKDRFVYIWGVCLIVLLVVCVSSFGISLRGIHAYFGNGTSGSFTVYGVNYNSSYPDNVMLDNKEHMDKQRTNFNMLLDNMFDVPDGYKFVGWKDSNGIQCMPGDVKFLESDIILYAEWVKDIEDDSDNENGENEDGDSTGELSGIVYGDVNLNGLIDEDDYQLVLDYIDGSTLSDVALINADVNDDKKVDLVDADIIKNAVLGTNGYVGFLPEKPILIYDIYEGNIDNGDSEIGDGDILGPDNDNTSGESSSNGDNTSDDSSSNGDDASLGGGGTGNGNSGSGGGNSSGGGGVGSSSGTSSGNGNSSGNNSSVSSNNSSSSDNNKVEEESKEDEVVVLEKKVFKFKYMNGLAKFDNTSCETTSGSCEIILPSKTPVREGYTFKGWSKNRNCKGRELIVTPVSVDSGDTYYACYLKNVDSEEEGNKYYIWAIVFLISCLSLRLIWHVIYKFRHAEENNEEIK